ITGLVGVGVGVLVARVAGAAEHGERQAGGQDRDAMEGHVIGPSGHELGNPSRIFWAIQGSRVASKPATAPKPTQSMVSTSMNRPPCTRPPSKLPINSRS